MSMHYEATNGTVPKQLADIFVRRAEGGAGYVVIDAVTVDHKYCTSARRPRWTRTPSSRSSPPLPSA